MKIVKKSKKLKAASRFRCGLSDERLQRRQSGAIRGVPNVLALAPASVSASVSASVVGGLCLWSMSSGCGMENDGCGCRSRVFRGT